MLPPINCSHFQQAKLLLRSSHKKSQAERKSSDKPTDIQIVLGLFVAALFFLGGSSRIDAAQTIYLGPMCCLFAGFALYRFNTSQNSGLKPLYWGLGLWAGLMLFQLVSLPYHIWSDFPGRDVIVEIDNVSGLGEIWRPVTFSASKTAASLASILVPFTALLLFHIYPKDRKQDFFGIIIVAAVLNALLAILQFLGPNDGFLYFYEFTNSSEAVGFFANRNHTAVFSSIALMVVGYVQANNINLFSVPNRLRNIILLASFAVIFFAILVNGSRAGLLTMGLAMIACAAMNFVKPRAARPKTQNLKMRVSKTRSSKTGIKSNYARLKGTLGAGFMLLAGVLVMSVFFLSDRLPAFNRLIDKDVNADQRYGTLPTLMEMVSTYWPMGSGFGTFDRVYFIHEPDHLLMAQYFNQAHNDWIQIVIEGGALAGLIVIGMLLWYLFSAVKLHFSAPDNRTHLIFWGGTLAILSIGSLVDYPLRTPIFAGVGICLLALLAHERGRFEQMRSKSRQ